MTSLLALAKNASPLTMKLTPEAVHSSPGERSNSSRETSASVSTLKIQTGMKARKTGIQKDSGDQGSESNIL